MSAFILHSDSLNFRALELRETPDLIDIVWRFNGNRIGEPLHLSAEADPETMCLPLADLEFFASHIPVFSERAAESLQNILRGRGDLLPVSYPDGKYFAYNVTCMLDALDIRSSDIQYFSTGRIMAVRSYVLKHDKISSPIFKLRQMPMGAVFVTSEFVQAVDKAQLTGFEFKPVRVLAQTSGLKA